MRSVAELKIKLFADGADKAQILQAQANPLIRGFHYQSHADARGRREGL